MTGNAAISVVVATRNRAHYLPEILQSLAQQQCAAAFEVVVIDNGSTDSTPNLLEAWCRHDSRFTSAREPQPGLSRAKNAGVRIASGNLLIFTDDDMRLGPDWIESYANFFTQYGHGLLVAGGPIIPIPHDLGAWPTWLGEEALQDAGALDYREQRELRRFEYLWGGNMAVPRVVFDQLGLWDETVGLQGDGRVTREDTEFFEDTELQDRVRKAGGSAWFCPVARVHHRIDRKMVTPRRVISTAFARGRNDFWQEEMRAWHEVDRVPKSNSLRSVASLATGLARWSFWVALFRFSRGALALERARRAAFESGRALDSLRAGRKSIWLFMGAARVVFPVRGLLLRLTPTIFRDDEGR
jgi:glycosyltransferase involved in cell wall biosynthesis